MGYSSGAEQPLRGALCVPTVATMTRALLVFALLLAACDGSALPDAGLDGGGVGDACSATKESAHLTRKSLPT